MSDEDEGAGLNLSGLWHGLYSYPTANPPAPFTATLTETDTWLVGGTEEIGTAGDARGQSLAATLQGRRTGYAITFLKTHDGRNRFYDAVHYAGEVRDDGTEIEDRGTAPGSWSGKFLMIRSSGVDDAVARKAAERVGPVQSAKDRRYSPARAAPRRNASTMARPASELGLNPRLRPNT